MLVDEAQSHLNYLFIYFKLRNLTCCVHLDVLNVDKMQDNEKTVKIF